MMDCRIRVSSEAKRAMKKTDMNYSGITLEPEKLSKYMMGLRLRAS